MMDESTVYFRFAGGILLLADRLKTSEIHIPIFFDGCPMEYLKRYTGKKIGKEFEDQMENCVCISSKSGDFDTEKFDRILKKASEEGKPVRAIDLRTKTGKLGKMMHSRLDYLDLDIDFRYVVMYDKDDKADMSVYRKELKDEERNYIRWLDKEDYNSIKPRKVEGSWVYPGLKENKIENLEVTKKLKKTIDQILG
ncbi:MAG: hypothetical protein JSV92_02115 [archaeon]|nr:MAG: hypothetical protein JSV92_02115 [archaeon]